MKQSYNQLTPEEDRVINHKGTEMPYSGEYYNFKGNGVYLCKKCDAPLYDSEDKFDSHCGWPSFDDEIEGAVTRVPDADGRRTEIVCTNCNGHLGHVFLGEQFTLKNTRHCVNSVSMNFVSREDFDVMINPSLDSVYFGAGCFWCIEAVFDLIDGVVSVESGYAGGSVDNPSYKEVTTGRTGHAEVIKLIYDINVVSFEKLLEIFFVSHDPTTPNRQGYDVGTQYRSVIYATTSKQMEIAEYWKQKLNQENAFPNPIVTEISAYKNYFPAENYHQQYFELNGEEPYCKIVIQPKVDKVLKLFKNDLKSKSTNY